LPTPADDNERILAEARAALVRQQAGGRRVETIGKRSAQLRRRHQLRKLLNMTIAVVAILVAAMFAGLFINGLGFAGIMVTALAIVAALLIFGSYPALKVPAIGAINRGDVRTLVGNTELWLETQRPALPAPAVQLVDHIGIQLDALGLQLEKIGEDRPAMADVRKLVGEHLPGLVSTYTAIPPHLRQEQSAGRSPDEELTASLGKISAEIDSVTRQLAAGEIDKLAVTTRFLDYKYGSGEEAKP
jgi:multisubunit Na+/H+ antiporter MnhB subunit